MEEGGGGWRQGGGDVWWRAQTNINITTGENNRHRRVKT